ncbi:MAG: hypothetical protein Ct9H90mP8_1680 [Pseudomonadota bacterium]|nr:MAG: hypothetical protein Ct9H90mP8_1680 [Pseudomonadota bacterium]
MELVKKKLGDPELPYGVHGVFDPIHTGCGKKNPIKFASINDFTTDQVEIELKTARGYHTDKLIKQFYA